MKIDYEAPQMNGTRRWITVYPRAQDAHRVRAMIEALGRWTEETDSDVIPGASMPSDISRMAEEIDAAEPILIRPAGARFLVKTTHLTIECSLVPMRHHTDPLGYEPPDDWQVAVHHMTAQGQPVGQPTTMSLTGLRDVERSNRAYHDLAADLYTTLTIAVERILNGSIARAAQFDGYTYR